MQKVIIILSFYFQGADENGHSSDSAGEKTPTQTKDLPTSELERLVKASEHRLHENLAFLNHKGDDKKGAVATGKGAEKLIVRISPTPMEVDESPNADAKDSPDVDQSTNQKKKMDES